MELKSGKYFVGDPCYVIDHNVKEQNNTWDHFCEHSFGRDAEEPFIDEVTGISIQACSTMHGDGLYPGSDGIEYAVDAGIIGVASIDHMTEEQITELKKLGRIVEFSGAPEVYSGGSIIYVDDRQSDGTFPKVQIETGDE